MCLALSSRLIFKITNREIASMENKTKIYFIDPINATIYYNFPLVHAIGEKYTNFHFLTSEFVYDDSVKPPAKTEYYFFRFTFFLSKKFNLNASLRRFLRGVEYPIDLVRILIKLNSEGECIIHFNYFVAPRLELIFLKLCNFIRCKIVITAHNPLPHDSGAKYEKIYKKLYKSASVIVTLTHYVKDELENLLQKSDSRICVIPHGDMGYIFNQVDSKNAITYLKPTLAFIGSISPYKGLMFLLEVIRLVLDTMDVQLLIIGIPYEPIEKYYARARELKIENNIIWQTGYAPLKEMYNRIRNAHLFVFPYESASQSGGIITAFTLNKPVVIRPTGGLPEMIHEGKDGISSDNVTDMSKSIIEILSDQDKYDNMVNFIRSERKSEIDWDHLSTLLIEEYQKINS